MNVPSHPTDGFLGCAASIAAFAASFVPSEESLRILCLILSMMASIATIIRVAKMK
jgi:hypothetical protein